MMEKVVENNQMSTEEILNYFYRNKKALLSKAKLTGTSYAEDIFQLVAMRLFTSKSDIEYLDTYLVRALMNERNNKDRSKISKAVEYRSDNYYDNQAYIRTPDKHLQSKQQQQIIKDAIANLPEKMSEAMYSYYIEDTDAPTMAKMKNLNKETIKVNRRNGLLRLKNNKSFIKKLEFIDWG